MKNIRNKIIEIKNIINENSYIKPIIYLELLSLPVLLANFPILLLEIICLVDVAGIGLLYSKKNKENKKEMIENIFETSLKENKNYEDDDKQNIINNVKDISIINDDFLVNKSSKENYRNLSSEEKYRTLSSKENYRNLSSEEKYRTLSSKENYRNLSSKENYRNLNSEGKYRTLSSKENYRNLSSEEKYRNLSSEEKYRTLSSKENYRNLNSEEKYKTLSLVKTKKR